MIWKIIVLILITMNQATERNAGIIPKLQKCSGGRLNKKDGLTRYGDSHVKDKTS